MFSYVCYFVYLNCIKEYSFLLPLLSQVVTICVLKLLKHKKVLGNTPIHRAHKEIQANLQ